MTVRSTCPYCGVGCGVVIRPDGQGRVTVTGDPDHPANHGRLCSKGSALAETLGLDGRLLVPRIAGKDSDWDSALDLVAQRFQHCIAEHGPDSVAFYVSGQLLTEDYYVANKLMKGFIGSANIDTNSRLCMASSVAGHRRAFGSDTVPGQYEDLELADVVVLVGSNLAWCHPVLYQRLAAAKERRPEMTIIVIDPRQTATCALADLHLQISPGADVALFNQLLVALADRGALDPAFLARVDGFDEALAAARRSADAPTGLTERDLAAFVGLWLGTERVVTVYSQGVNQSQQGTDKVNAILNCHLATGRIGRPGVGPFSVTGQPNAMGGREVGGLANALTCHLDIENAVHRQAVQTFWSAPTMAGQAGLKAVDMFRAVEEGRIKAIWIICTNPAVSMPEAARIRRALAACDFVVVSDCMADTDTTRLADVVFPAATWGEREGSVTNSERCISRQRAFRAPPGMARQDWRILAGVAARMGWSHAFSWSSSAEIFAEFAALSGVAARLGSDFDISAHEGINPARYEALAPFVWPATTERQGGRFFGAGQFHTPSGKGRMVPVTPAPAPVTDLPFRLNTGRIRDHWHTMTRTGQSPRLSAHLAEPFLEIHPEDARRRGIEPAALVWVYNTHGRALLRALITDRVRPGEVFAPIHWTGETSAAGRIADLVTARVDPVSGQPDSKAAAVDLQAFKAGWYGFAISARAFRPGSDYWALARAEGGWRAELAGRIPPSDWQAWARALFGCPTATVSAVSDPRRGLVRLAFSEGDRLVAALFVARDPVALSRGHVTAALGSAPDPSFLAGQPGRGAPDAGATVCACFGVGVNTITAAIRAGHGLTVAELGASLRAGTNCGACQPELKALIARHRRVPACQPA